MIKKEIAKTGIIPDPNAPIDPETGATFRYWQQAMDLGKPQVEPDIDGSPAEAPEIPNGGEI